MALVVVEAEELRALIRDAVDTALAAREDGDRANDVLTRKQAAELLQVDVHTITKYVRVDGMPGHLRNGKWRFRRGAILAWRMENP